MRRTNNILLVIFIVICLCGGCGTDATRTPGQPSTVSADPLPAWNDTGARQIITRFVTETTDSAHPMFIPENERIAVFDNDGTLWMEQPMYTQMVFAFDRLQLLAPDHPEWRETEPYQSMLHGTPELFAEFSREDMVKIMLATHAGVNSGQFQTAVSNWIEQARHPRFDKPYTNCYYQPMRELLDYLRVNGYKTFIVSGGGLDYMRVFTEKIYGIPPEQVVGTMIQTRFEFNDGEPVFVRDPEYFFIDDREGKPVGIHHFIGRRPIIAFGNSDGDLQMLQYTAAGDGPRLAALIHHDDARREYAYDRESKVGHLDQALDEASKNNWLVVSMKRDFRSIFPFAVSGEEQ